ncbi:cupin domain-containing protein [Reichenbachiella versicolor]|uniref:cupin domain-containing protein n=1 Tax=Reichenbachiella versicolor TaxID=1821036 RepID=UPI000D6E701B|nr:cupin domain-containing protein [Reichenbachiella versicolor]
MKRTKENSQHYYWGDGCEGWHLVKSSELSIIEERMPPGTEEVKHYHETAQQFFQILKGTATFELEDETIMIHEKEGFHIKPEIKHKILNNGDVPLEFIVISSPTTRGDRIDEPFEK